MSTWLGHEWILAHFLATGLLFFWPIMGVDPAPRRPTHLMRMLELFIGMPFHAFFGIAVMMSSGLLVGYFAHPPTSWHISALSDQTTGGGIAWAFSEVPTLLALLAAVVRLRPPHRSPHRPPGTPRQRRRTHRLQRVPDPPRSRRPTPDGLTTAASRDPTTGVSSTRQRLRRVAFGGTTGGLNWGP